MIQLTKGIARNDLAFRQNDLTREVRIGSNSISVVELLARDELRNMLDPQEVYGSDFPGETFRVLKEKEMKAYGEFRTRRLVLEKWDALNGL
jgi:hypothetical protein